MFYQNINMKPEKIWANLAVADIERTVAFYTKLGFILNGKYQTDKLASFIFGKTGFIINFFIKEKLEASMNSPVADITNGNEIIFSLSAETEDEVNTCAKEVEDAGGTIIKQPGTYEDGFYYCVFADPDGHKYNTLAMKAGM